MEIINTAKQSKSFDNNNQLECHRHFFRTHATYITHTANIHLQRIYFRSGKSIRFISIRHIDCNSDKYSNNGPSKKKRPSSLFWNFGITLSEATNAIGVGNIFYAYQGELFSNDVKNVGISFTYNFYMLLSFLVLVKFQGLIEFFGISTIFWFFSISAVLIPYMIFRIALETKGKSLDEIQIMMKC